MARALSPVFSTLAALAHGALERACGHPAYPVCRQAVAVRLVDGRECAAAATLLSSVNLIPASSALLFTLAEENSEKRPVFEAIYSQQEDITDLLALAAFASPDCRIVTGSNTSVFLHSVVHNVPPFHDTGRACRLHLEGEGLLHGSSAWQPLCLRGSSLPWQPDNDPELATPLRLLLARLYQNYRDWRDVRLVIADECGWHPLFPLSGRDLQALYRETGGDTVIERPVTGERHTLASLMPGAYRSGNMRGIPAGAGQGNFWKDAEKTLLEAALGQGLLQRLEEAASSVLGHINGGNAPRAAAALLADGRAVPAANIAVPGAMVPSCAETLSLQAAVSLAPDVPLRALLLRINDEHNHPLLGEQAAPCGFCRESIQRLAQEDTLVILADGHGHYQAMPATALLHKPFLPSLLPAPVVPLSDDRHPLFQQALALWKTHDYRLPLLLSAGNGMAVSLAHDYADCAWPPMLAQKLVQEGRTSTEMLLLQQERNAGTVNAWLRKALKLATSSRLVLHLATPEQGITGRYEEEGGA